MKRVKLVSNIGFKVYRSQISGRLDPIFYNSDLTKFNEGNFKSFPLSFLVKSFKSGIGAGKQDQSDASSGIIQIRPTNLSTDGFLKFEKNVYVPKDGNFDTLEVDDVIFNNTNSQELVGKTAILKETIALSFSNHITRIRVNTDRIIADYLWIILNIYQKHKIFFSICTNWNNQSGIGLDVLKTLKIPVPPISIQKQIVTFYQEACSSKQQKATEAKSILNNLDKYFLDQLGISLPVKDQSLKARINSKVYLRNILGSRFDPMLYDRNTIALKQSIANINHANYIAVPLRSLVVHSVAGDWGLDENEIVDDYEKFEKCLVIRATEFDNNFNLKLDNSRTKYRLVKKEKLQKIDIQENDLLIEKSGGSVDQPVGRISIINKEVINTGAICYSNFIYKIRVNSSKINPTYLFCYLKTIHNIKLTEAMQSQTNGIRNLIMSTYLNQDIVIPIDDRGFFDLEKQRKISTYISQLRSKAKKLQHDAKDVLEKAIEKVEQILLTQN